MVLTLSVSVTGKLFTSPLFCVLSCHWLAYCTFRSVSIKHTAFPPLIMHLSSPQIPVHFLSSYFNYKIFEIHFCILEIVVFR